MRVSSARAQRGPAADGRGPCSVRFGAQSAAGVYHAVVPLAPASGHAAHGTEPQGTVSFDARVSLVTSGGGVVPLNRDATSATVRIEGTDTALVAREQVEATTYTRARVTFTRVAANVTGGLSIGGISVTGQIRVGIAPGDSVVVEAPVEIRGRAKQTLIIDLDASEWLSQSSAGIVSTSDFRSAVDLRVR
jgi:hypothetical protein